MTLSPFEVERREFAKSTRGYKPREVDDFLTDVQHSLTELWQERTDLREENQRLKDRLSSYEQLESQLTSTLMLAQDSAEKAHEQARRESELVMREAGQKARDLIHAAHEEKQRLGMVLRDLHSAEQEARQRMRVLSQTVLSHLDDTDALVNDGATTLRAIVQAHPEVESLRSGTTGEIARLEANVSRSRRAGQPRAAAADGARQAGQPSATADAAGPARPPRAGADRESAPNPAGASATSAPASGAAPRTPREGERRVGATAGNSPRTGGDAGMKPMTAGPIGASTEGGRPSRAASRSRTADDFFDTPPSFDLPARPAKRESAPTGR